ncbi:MAG: mercury resistance system transport protein MerF [Nitrospirota bacterium]
MAAASSRLLKTGAVGSTIAAVCCFTPILVVLLGALGLGAIAGYLDYVLLPVLGLCLAILAYGLYLRRRERAACCPPQANHREPR